MHIVDYTCTIKQTTLKTYTSCINKLCLFIPRNKTGGIAEAGICANSAKACAQLDTLIDAALAARKNWRRLVAAVQGALSVFRTRTVYSYMVARADYSAVGLKYKVLTDVLYRHNDFLESGYISLCTCKQDL